ncbi:MAG: hypothetical protein AAGL89_02595 [Pseudomonadota bacterium]
MTERSDAQKTPFLWILAGSVLLPVLIIGAILLFGEDWSRSEEAKRADLLFIGALIVVFGASWLSKVPFWDGAPGYIRHRREELLFAFGGSVFIAFHDADPEAEGAAWWGSFIYEFFLCVAIFVFIFAIAELFGLYRRRREARKIKY